ncbi:MAG TPA: pyruvate, phosphate dikinase [Candidatus Woesearchaeota archaeon]|nr:pyruvate, phosphate dikinase [Candidatus Woesearchaeota archaeon]
MMAKLVYSFSEGNKDMKPLLGGKGANLAEMNSLGIPVPPGFIITTEACRQYYENRNVFSAKLKQEVLTHLEEIEKKLGRKLGDNYNPLLVSIRSGAAVSMPGMMDTILNLGLNDQSVLGLAKSSGNERFAYDSYRRFIQMFSNVVLGLDHSAFEKILHELKSEKGYEQDTEMTAEDLKALVESYKDEVKNSSGSEFPQDPHEQLWRSIEAVFKSWNNNRAKEYRKIHNISGLFGTAVTIQSMVFGNLGDTSGTGVCFTRNPSTGENIFFGEYLKNSQGEDVVAGIRTPKPIKELEKDMPEIYKKLVAIKDNLESHYKDMQDIEFTIQEGKLYILQTRSGKRAGIAAVRIAVEMAEEGLIDEKQALLRVEPNSLNQLLHKRIDPAEIKNREPSASGLPASPGAAVGRIVFTAEDAFEWAEKGENVILVRTETSPEDIKGMNAAQGILTLRGGMTSHAAVVARGMGKCAIVGCSDLTIDEKAKVLKSAKPAKALKEGDWLSLDGSSGKVYFEKLNVSEPELSDDFSKIMGWAKEYKKLGVRANADSPKDAETARGFGAEGIGLCRTEHMFFEGDRIKAMREMIVSDTREGRKKALDKLLPMQRKDFVGLFESMQGLPVTIRLLDPPLHEFLPKEEIDIAEIAKELAIQPQELKEKINSLEEVNPMLGFRGCRLLINFPEIAEMQTQAIIEAACIAKKKSGAEVEPEIMIPLIGHVNELKWLKEVIRKTVESVLKEQKISLSYKIGTMIEVPRAVLVSDKIAEHSEFFSFGTNDLTQMTFGFSRDDFGKFLPQYLDQQILEEDPFKSIDQEGVGKLVEMSVALGRKTSPKLKIGICGEHGGDPKSVEFCHKAGLDYVSCSPYRIPIAILSAAQAALKNPIKPENK